MNNMVRKIKNIKKGEDEKQTKEEKEEDNNDDEDDSDDDEDDNDDDGDDGRNRVRFFSDGMRTKQKHDVITHMRLNMCHCLLSPKILMFFYHQFCMIPIINIL